MPAVKPTRAERRLRLQELATRRIIDRGYEGLSVNDLAEDMGLSVGGLYRYIKTKSDLLVLACEDIYGGVRETLVGIATGSDADLEEKLRQTIEVYLRECLRNQDQILLMYREYRHLPPEAHERYKERERAVAGVFADLIVSGVGRGIFREVDARLLAYDVVFLGHQPALKGWATHEVSGVDALVDHQVELVMTRLRPGSDHPSPARHGRE